MILICALLCAAKSSSSYSGYIKRILTGNFTVVSVSGSLNFNDKYISIENLNASSRKISIGETVCQVTLSDDSHGKIEFNGGSGVFEVDETQSAPFHVIKGNLGELGQFHISVISVTTVRVVLMRGNDVASIHLEKHVSWVQKVTIFGDPKAVLGIVLVVLLPVLLGFLSRKLDTVKANKHVATNTDQPKDVNPKEKEE